MWLQSPEELGKAVRDLRKKLGVRQADLALVSGTGIRFIVDLEKGKPTCQIGKIFQVLEALGATLEFKSRAAASEKGR